MMIISIRKNLDLYRRNVGVPFLNDEEEEKYQIFMDFFDVFTLEELDDEINKRYPCSDEELETEDGLGDFIYSEYEELVGETWCKMMEKYLPKLWKRLEEDRIEKDKAWKKAEEDYNYWDSFCQRYDIETNEYDLPF